MDWYENPHPEATFKGWSPPNSIRGMDGFLAISKKVYDGPMPWYYTLDMAYKIQLLVNIKLTSGAN